MRLTPSQLEIGRQLYISRQYTKTLHYLRPLVQKNPEDVRALKLLANTYLAIGHRKSARKYYRIALKVDPKKRILFDPEASVDFNGNTGPFIQYTHARIQSILRQAPTPKAPVEISEALEPKEKAVLQQLLLYPDTVQQAAKAYSPALIANYLYDLVKTFNSFYQNISILGVTDQKQKAFRVALTQKVGDTIRNASGLLGIAAPNQM